MQNSRKHDLADKEEKIMGLDESGGPEKTTITLKSKDGQTFVLEKKVAAVCKLVATTLEFDKATEEITLDLSAAMLSTIIDFLEHYALDPMPTIPKPIRTQNLAELLPGTAQWYVTYIAVDQLTILDVIMAANYLDCPPLLDLCAAKIATMLFGRSPEEIREEFKLRNDFTPMEEQLLISETRWAREV